MRVTVVGCSGSLAGPGSPASSYLVQADDAEGRTWNLLLDLGSGALGALQRHLDPMRLDAIAFSHLHPDHCADLSGLYVMRRYAPGHHDETQLPVWGPTGTAEWMALAYYGLSPEGMRHEFDFRHVGDDSTFEVGPMTVTAIAVDHPVEAYGYRVECDGKVLAYSGDTDATPALRRLLISADLALLDCAFVDGRDTIRGIHLSGSRAAQAAVEAGGVKRLVLTHLPPWNDPVVCRSQAAAIWPGEVEMARPDAAYEL